MERIKTRVNTHREVYHDTSSRGKGRPRHDCWRADVTIQDASGKRRIRRRFSTRAEAEAWLSGH